MTDNDGTDDDEDNDDDNDGIIDSEDNDDDGDGIPDSIDGRHRVPSYRVKICHLYTEFSGLKKFNLSTSLN